MCVCVCVWVWVGVPQPLEGVAVCGSRLMFTLNTLFSHTLVPPCFEKKCFKSGCFGRPVEHFWRCRGFGDPHPHTQRLELSLTGDSLGVCVCVFGCGGGALQPYPSLPCFPERGVCCCNAYDDANAPYSHTHNSSM